MASISNLLLAMPVVTYKSQFMPVKLRNQQFRSNRQFQRNYVHTLREQGVLTLKKELNGPQETFPVKKSEPVLVHPATTDSGHYYLSKMDHELMVPMDVLYSYKGNGMESTDNAYKIVKESLAEVLVYFYPLAGRLTMAQDGKFVVNCTGEGVYFVEAVIEQDLDEFGDITKPGLAKYRQLLHAPPAERFVDMPLLTVQVTLFRCGGFIIGTRLNHCMMDATSVDHFMNSWAEIARGLPITAPPCLDRSLLKPKQVSDSEYSRSLLSKINGMFIKRDIGKSMCIPQYKQLYSSIHFGPEKLMQLKKIVMEEGIERIPTNFELLTAFMSRAIIKSVKVREPNQSIKLFVPVNGRSRLSLPKEYFGNCIAFAYVGCYKEDQFAECPLSVIVSQLQEAIKLVTADSIQTLLSYSEAMGLQVSSQNTFSFSNMTRMFYYKPDFGFGAVKQFGLATLPENEVYFLPQKKFDRNNVTAVVGLSNSDMNIFEESLS